MVNTASGTASVPGNFNAPTGGFYVNPRCHVPRVYCAIGPATKRGAVSSVGVHVDQTEVPGTGGRNNRGGEKTALTALVSRRD